MDRSFVVDLINGWNDLGGDYYGKEKSYNFRGHCFVAILVMAMSMGCIEEAKEEKEKIAEDVEAGEEGFAEEVKEEKTAPVAEELKERFGEAAEELKEKV